MWRMLRVAAVAALSLGLSSAAEEQASIPIESVRPPVLSSAIPRRVLQETDEASKTPMQEDPNFDPYQEDTTAQPRVAQAEPTYQPRQRVVEAFDFDPSEGLTFHVYGGKQECFFQDAKFTGDEISGAYIVSSADSHIDLEIKNPAGVVVYRRLGDAEGQYQVIPPEPGIYELCFLNTDSDGKLVTHVTNTLQSQHPVQREHVSVLAKYASHLDVRLGQLESEQRLQHIRTDRAIRIEEMTSQRVAFYGTLECFVYLLICVFQVVYIKNLLDAPRASKSWA
ncbi:hypothetical protein Poli38472_010547 [Pythium oligandrum]|uniref:GOLD domain-containing protein n=1 Tax=Pythium oligandrum TaxID=41045 RepID=A0A8K1F9W8_PYTOL|nr:hypothetical protein Poli38472_010547 [Pythium oligandrum]|eukprot:TMW55665.1 hypothetical protein Poli38472_010547 [Pythium oligandrum]